MTHSQSIRNVVVTSYVGAGKTSLVEALLFSAGVTSSMGTTTNGTAVADFEAEEIQHHHSMSTALLQYEHKGTFLTLLDTPGSLDFFADTHNTIHVADGAVLVVGASGIRAELERIWECIQARELPCLVFINELDKERTNFESVLEEIQKTLEIPCVPIAYPIGSEANLQGVVDLVTQQAIIPVPNSHKVREEEIPADLKENIAALRKQLVETVAESDDALVEKYLSEGDLTQEEILQGLTLSTKNRRCIPVACGSAILNLGTTVLHQAIMQYLPSPEERAAAFPWTGVHPDTNEALVRDMKAEEPLAGYVFKTTIDPFMGRLTYLKVCAGVLEADSTFFNSVRNVKEKGGHLYYLQGKKSTQTQRAVAGEIVVMGKLKETQTGETICADKAPIVLPAVQIRRPVMSFALEPKSKGDIDKVSLGLHKLVEEDASLEFIRNDETKEMLLSGVGQTHIELTLEKLRRKYGVDVNLHTPKVAYRETIQKMAQAQGKYKKQTGGHGQYGDCWLQLDPLPRNGGFEFLNKIVGGVIPRNFIPAVEKGVVEAMHEGMLAGFPVVDVQVTVYDGSHHPVDSSEMAFKVAASMGFKKAMESAQPVLLEPIMNVEVSAPDEMVGTVIGDLNSRRGRILGMDAKGHHQIVKAVVPLAEILKYAPVLTSITAGKGSYIMEFSGYEPAPREVVNKVVEEHKAAKEAASS